MSVDCFRQQKISQIGMRVFNMEKSCLFCSGIIGKMKPSKLAKTKFCSHVCSQLYAIGNRNANWKGGGVIKICAICGVEFKVCLANSNVSKYCGRACQIKSRIGEGNCMWRGGALEFKKRHAEKIIFKKMAKIKIPKTKNENKQKAARFPCKCIQCGITRMLRRVKKSDLLRKCRACQFKSMGGEGNPGWKGGIKAANAKIRSSPEYIEWRTKVFVRDKFQCVLCGQKGGNLNADHIKSFSCYPELRLSLENGRTLCVQCHKKTDNYMAKALKEKRNKDAQSS
jgi:uncharacterized protein YlzI (FlbEa/FlbD family)